MDNFPLTVFLMQHEGVARDFLNAVRPFEHNLIRCPGDIAFLIGFNAAHIDLRPPKSGCGTISLTRQ